jgi:hypothetical protein
MPNTVRWSAYCGCRFHLEIDDQHPDGAKFLLADIICNSHKPLASTKHRENHSELSKRPLALLKEAQISNLKQVDDLISTEMRPRKLRDLVKCREIVVRINDDNTEEWNEIVTQPHAFDEHIHPIVWKEHQARNG